MALVAMLVMFPLFTVGSLQPEVSLPTDNAATPPQYLEPIHPRSSAVLPEPVSVPLAVQVVMKPFLFC